MCRLATKLASARLQVYQQESEMNRIIAAAAGIAFVAVGAAAPASAKGCMKGAAVGAVAGHLMGHHGKAGAAAGCVAGHHHAKKKVRKH